MIKRRSNWSACPRSNCDYFGLPAVNDVPIYDVYTIKPKEGATVFVSKIAPVSELNGKLTAPGGGIQYIIPNRNHFEDAVLEPYKVKNY